MLLDYLYVFYVGSEKVITVDVEKTIVIDATENVEDNEIKEEDAKKLHNYNLYLVAS